MNASRIILMSGCTLAIVLSILITGDRIATSLESVCPDMDDVEYREASLSGRWAL